jgi:hypothetical protein
MYTVPPGRRQRFQGRTRRSLTAPSPTCSRMPVNDGHGGGGCIMLSSTQWLYGILVLRFPLDFKLTDRHETFGSYSSPLLLTS